MTKTTDNNSEEHRLERSYDDIPYFDGNAFTPSHPNNLAILACLNGFSSADPAKCRVLELACGCGGNLVAMAQSLPESSFTGIDLSSQQIERARELADSVGLNNIEFQKKNLLDVEEGFGEFDYIIAYGVFSWVPEKVQDKIFKICSQNLAQNGIAFIGYQVFPGGEIATTIRDIMHFHLEGVTDPMQRLAKGQELLAILSESAELKPHAMANVYRQLHAATQQDVRVFYHEYLNLETRPLYFHEFMASAVKYDLCYVDEGKQSAEFILPEVVEEKLDGLKIGLLDKEQYRDYLVHRSDRNSLLARGESQVDGISEEVAIEDFYICSALTPASSRIDCLSSMPEEFTSQAGIRVSLTQPEAKLVFSCLRRYWPLGIPFSELLSQIQDHLKNAKIATDETESRIKNVLLEQFRMGRVEFRFLLPECVSAASIRPVASPLVRYQAAHSDGMHVTNQRHVNIQIGPLGTHLLPLLDGSNDLEALALHLQRLIKAGKFSWPNQSAVDIDLPLDKIQTHISQVLEVYVQSSLLIA